MATTTTTNTAAPTPGAGADHHAAESVTATVSYYLQPKDGGDTHIYPGTVLNTRRKYDPREVLITDIRGREQDFSLDVHGFQFVDSASGFQDFGDGEKVKSEYYVEVAEVLREKTGATRVHPFSHIVRRNNFEDVLAAREGKAEQDSIPLISPTVYAHVDQSYDGAVQILRQESNQDEAQRLGKTRWGIINLWRPIGKPVLRSPLTLCDARSVADEELLPVVAKLPSKNAGGFENATKGDGFEIWQLISGKEREHKWYFASEMKPEECWLIKCFDSKLDGRARRAPHAAFELLWTKAGEPPRESIEVRYLVFWEDDPVE